VISSLKRAQTTPTRRPAPRTTPLIVGMGRET
jgi:hypothetical protein